MARWSQAHALAVAAGDAEWADMPEAYRHIARAAWQQKDQPPHESKPAQAGTAKAHNGEATCVSLPAVFAPHARPPAIFATTKRHC